MIALGLSRGVSPIILVMSLFECLGWIYSCCRFVSEQSFFSILCWSLEAVEKVKFYWKFARDSFILELSGQIACLWCNVLRASLARIPFWDLYRFLCFGSLVKFSGQLTNYLVHKTYGIIARMHIQYCRGFDVPSLCIPMILRGIDSVLDVTIMGVRRELHT